MRGVAKSRTQVKGLIMHTAEGGGGGYQNV